MESQIKLDLIKITSVKRLEHLIFLIEYGCEIIPGFNSETRLPVGTMHTLDQIKAMRFNTLMESAKHYCRSHTIDFQNEICNEFTYRKYVALGGEYEPEPTPLRRNLRKNAKTDYRLKPIERKKRFPDIDLKQFNPSELLNKEKKLVLWPGGLGNYGKKPHRNLIQLGKQLAEKKITGS
ncbi:MAG: hypothetical protein ABIQ27_08805 [Flavobacterium sp.]|uniref:hypothetical protein n=1 Tax=Flavobacterium sp. TaxID=239 RepID=UPI0032679A93